MKLNVPCEMYLMFGATTEPSLESILLIRPDRVEDAESVLI